MGRPDSLRRLAAAVLWCAAGAHTAPELLRDLPLHHFPASRQTQTDAQGFYSMPTAIGDDYFDGTSPLSRVEHDLETARRGGAAYLRCAFSWNGIEKEQGQYDWTFWDSLVKLAEQNRIKLIPYVAYPPRWAVRQEKDFWKQPPRDPRLYGDFMYRIASRYRGRIAAWEIWNEPDNREYWTGTADEFAALARLAARRIREADPNAVVVLGGMANGPSAFFKRLIGKDHMDRDVDVVAMHAYPETWSNERAEALFAEWIPAMSEAIARDRSGADLWLNEMGYADYRFRPNQASVYGYDVFYSYEHTPAYQAAMLFKFEVMALASGRVSLTGWYRADDFPSSETRLGNDLVNYHLGLTDTKGQPKPVLRALGFFHNLLGGRTRLMKAKLDRAAGSQSVADLFQRADGELIAVAWLRSSLPGEVSQYSGMLQDRRSEEISIELPCAHPALEGAFDPEGRRVSSGARVAGDILEGIELRGGQVFV
ncbi:MAG TPA: cellulase family glycosylhydrolase, partial [Bryobacteraceae bacterium]|nr:cellulase family glycosylhydrolase [Bryobacteraceae bacterium]